MLRDLVRLPNGEAMLVFQDGDLEHIGARESVGVLHLSDAIILHGLDDGGIHPQEP